MGVAPSSATSMLKKLAALGLAEHAPYRGVELTEAGGEDRARGDPPPPPARAVPRRDAGPRDRRGARRGRPARARPLRGARGADRPGARVSRRTTRTATRFRTRRLNVERPELRSLEALEPGEEATVRRIPDGDAGLLRYLAELDLLAGRGDRAKRGALRRAGHGRRGGDASTPSPASSRARSASPDPCYSTGEPA